MFFYQTLFSFTIILGWFYISKRILKNYFILQTQQFPMNDLLKEVPIQNLYQCSIYSQLAYNNYNTFFQNVFELNKNKDNFVIYFDENERITRLKQNLITRAIYIDAREFAKDPFNEDTQLYLFSKENILYVAFRGTSSIFDIKTDLNIFISSNEWVQVHKGFLKQYNAINLKLHQEIYNWIYTYNNDNNTDKIDTLIFTGHSLGGALAMLASYDLCSYFPNLQIKCYTFGAPRIGNQSFINELEKKNIEIWRVCNIEDVVPLLPLSFRFTHCNKNSLFLSLIRNNNVCFTTNTFSKGFELNHHWYLRPLGFLLASKWYYPLSAHHSKLYVEMLKTICESNNVF